MERREFLRKSILAAIGLSAASSVINAIASPKEKELKLDWTLKSEGREWIREQYRRAPDAKKLCYSFKISPEILEDKEMFFALLRDQRLPDQEPYSMVVGWENDDFIKDQQTVLLTYYV